eukprot:5814553-Amphidinium_carterae.2
MGPLDSVPPVVKDSCEHHGIDVGEEGCDAYQFKSECWMVRTLTALIAELETDLAIRKVHCQRPVETKDVANMANFHTFSL